MVDINLKNALLATVFFLSFDHDRSLAQNFSDKAIIKRQQQLVKIVERRNCSNAKKPFKCILIYTLLFNEAIPDDMVGRQRILKKTDLAYRKGFKFPASEAIITDQNNVIVGYGFADYKLASCEDSLRTKGRGYRELVRYNDTYHPEAFFMRFGTDTDLYLAKKGDQLDVLVFRNDVLTKMSLEEFVRDHWNEYFGRNYVDKLGYLAGSI